MDVLKEQRVYIKFCQKLGKTATEMYEMLQQAFGETAFSRSKTSEWYSRFKNGRTSINDDPHIGRPSTARTNETVDRVNAVIRGNRRFTIREIADELNLPFGTCQAILTQDLGMRRVSEKLVPRLLTQDQTEHRATACRELLQRAENYATFLSSIITGDESWVYGYDPETKQMPQWKMPSSPRPKKARQVRSNVKTMLIAFFDAEGLVHHEFLPQRQTMNQTVYITVLQRLRDAVRLKRPRKWSSGTWLLHHDNALCHAALSVRELLAKHSTSVVPHPPYSQDLAPCDFFVFPRLKSTLKGKRFQDVAEIQLNTKRQLQTIPRQAYQTCVEKWKDRWKRCIQSGELYFKGDKFE
jgi:histone-lysine N-methyltransferase SETMAR